MPIKFLGKVLFPRLPEWQRRRQTKSLLVAIAVALLFTAVVVGFMFFQNNRR